MAWQTKNPERILGGNPVSGGVNTGEQQHVRGGSYKAVVLSGALTPIVVGGSPGITVPVVAVAALSMNAVLFSGAGRLNSILPHQQLTSGLPVYFYDAASSVSGLNVSGQSITALIPPTWIGGAVSGYPSNGMPWNGEPIRPDMPFYSGLCVSAPSGTPGFVVSWTPDTVPANPAQ